MADNQVHKESMPFPGTVSDNPQIAKQVLDLIDIWGHIEAYVSNLICLVVKSDYRVVNTMLSRVNSFDLKLEMLEKLAAFSLEQDDDGYRLLKAVIEKMRQIRMARNLLGHSLWGVSEDKTALTLMPLDYALMLDSARRDAEQNFQWIVDRISKGNTTFRLKDYAKLNPARYRERVHSFGAEELEAEVNIAFTVLTHVWLLYVSLDDPVADRRSEARKLLSIDLQIQS